MPPTDAAPATETPPVTLSSVKGFELDWTCRGYQFALGGTYTHEGKVEACASGWHACEYPLDVFGYYPPGQSRYADVTQGGTISRKGDDTKIASATITINTELRIPEPVERAVKWVIAQCKPADGQHCTGNQSAASSTGDRSAAMSSGMQGRVMAANGCALFLVYRDEDTYDILHAWAGVAGKSGIKPLVWYQLGADGLPVEVGSGAAA